MNSLPITEREDLIDVPGGKLFVKSWSPATRMMKPPIILFHDSLGCVDLWRDFPGKLCQKLARPVIAYDRLGFGKSSERHELPSANFINEEAEIYFPVLLQALSVHSFDLFGHSVGGAMAIACAAKIPGCRTVVTESAQAFVEERTVEGILKAKEEFKDPAYFSKLTKYHGTKASWVLKAWTDVWLSDQFKSWSLAPLLEQVQCPVLAIHGELDPYGSKAFPEMISQSVRGPSEMLLIPECGHVPHREMPETVLTRVQEFYARF